MLFASGSHLRLRLSEEKNSTRKPGWAHIQYVALRGAFAAAGRLYTSQRGWRDTFGCLAETGVALGHQECVFQERCSLLPFPVVQRPRGGNGSGSGETVWF